MRLLAALCLLFACACAHAQVLRVDRLETAAPGLSGKPLRVRVYLPPEYASTQARYQVLYVNDGQDVHAVGMLDTLEQLYARYAIARIIVVAIDMPPDRMAGYGLFDRAKGEATTAATRYGTIGADAWLYAQWLTQTLVPMVDARYRTIARADGRAILGWSLGALSAFGIGWQYPELFGRVGAFSPSFWLAADNKDADAVQTTRIVHRLVDASSATMPRPDLFFGVGSREETDDRDGDGIIDVLDDTQELVDGWTSPAGTPHEGLRRFGYGVNLDQAHRPSRDRAVLLVLAGGEHDQSSWARMLPVFLRWAYPAGKDAAQAR